MKGSCVQEKLYLSNKPLKYVLECNENMFRDIFRESELKSQSPTQYKAILDSQIISETYQDIERSLYYDKNKTAYRVRRDGNDHVGYRVRGDGDATIILASEDKKFFKFDFKRLCQIIKKKNLFSGVVDALSQRVLFVGSHSALNYTVNIVLAFLCDDETAEKELYALPSRLTKSDKIVVLCPAYAIKSMELSKKLQDKNIFCFEFSQIMSKDFQVDLSKISTDNGKQEFQIPPISQKERSGYNTHDYKRQDIIEFSDHKAGYRKIRLSVNGVVHDVSYSEVVFLMLMAIKLKENNGGWVSLNDLTNEGIVSDDLKTNAFTQMHWIISKLTNRFGKNGLIENSQGEGQYRLSTHPLRVKEPSSNWLKKTYKYTVLPVVKKTKAKRAGKKA